MIYNAAHYRLGEKLGSHSLGQMDGLHCQFDLATEEDKGSGI